MNDNGYIHALHDHPAQPCLHLSDNLFSQVVVGITIESLSVAIRTYPFTGTPWPLPSKIALFTLADFMR
jgi:hypothetical protein